MLNADFLQTLWLTGKLAGLTTCILLLVGLPIAYLLAYKRFFMRSFVEALISMPMVLPPTVLGFYMLILYSPTNAFGRWWEALTGNRLAFSFEGVLLASIVFGMPFMIQPLQNGFSAIPRSLREAAATLGKSRMSIFFNVLLPNMVPALVTAMALTFAHCIGEFGVVIMVGGNMPGETRVASIAIYDEVQALNYETANQYSLVLFLISLFLLTLIYGFNRTRKHSTYVNH